MITEERLRSLLAEAAAEPPADGPARIVASASSGPAPRPRWLDGRLPLVTPLRLMAAAAVSVLVMAAALAWLDGGSSTDEVAGPTRSDARFASGSGSGSSPTAGSGSSPTAAPAAGPAPAPPILAMPEAAAAQSPQPMRSGVSSGASAPGPMPAALGSVPSAFGSVPSAGPESGLARIVKTGGLELSVPRGHVVDVVATVIRTATAAGGYVADSTTTETGGRTTGTITVRVPAERFESVTDGLRRLGRVRQATTGGRDVTGEYTDIEARLRTLQATRDALFQVLGDAHSVGDILAVQNNLTSVQSEIEQLQGRQRVLDDQVTQASIAVSVREDGRAKAAHHAKGEPSSWERAVDGFTGTWSALLARSGTALAVVLIGAALVAASAGLARWGRRAYARRAA